MGPTEGIMVRITAAFCAISWLVFAPGSAADHVTFRTDEGLRSVEGNVLARDRRGTILLEGRDSQQFIIPPSSVLRWENVGTKVAPFTKQELRNNLQAEFGLRFKAYQTAHYLIFHSCETSYAKDAGKLFELTYSRFMNFFQQRGKFELRAPSQPLVAIICQSREEYVMMVSKYLGEFATSTAGIYVPASNRMYMYNAFGGQTGNVLRKNLVLNRPAVENFAAILREQNISVIVHEAVHHVAFNSGFHNRNVANPTWLVEGMAMFFEVPDLDAKSGVGGLGSVNEERFSHYTSMPASVHREAMVQIVTDDDIFRDRRTAADAYAQAWALTYYLARARTKEYMAYLRLVNARPPMRSYPAEERLADFRTAFGESPADVETEMRRFLLRLVERRARR
jgi:hypothetical protein